MKISRPLPDQYATIRWITRFVEERGFKAVEQDIDAGYYGVYCRVWVLKHDDDLSDKRSRGRRFWCYPDPGYAERALLLVHPYQGTRIVESRAPKHDEFALQVGAALEEFCGETVFVELKTPHAMAEEIR